MLYLVAIVFPWLALLFAGKPLQAMLSLGLSIIAVIGFLFFLLPGILFWLLSVAHAFAVISGAHADKRTKQIVAAIREGQNAQPTSTSTS
jgi:hypothetical protein